MFLILQKQVGEKQDLTASMLLYEKVEENFWGNISTEEIITIDGIQYLITLQKVNNIIWKACVNYEEKQICIMEESQPEGVHLSRMHSFITSYFYDSFFFSSFYKSI
ncbi:hypothetical protein ACQKP0_08030 [Heyndrickxia sp. NPDC080065]|uniref:hypothetical protein n=1 Tax=Heyndrickxia sp. NPDC080065 TaxID=3390568 RepID=UPI003D036842